MNITFAIDGVPKWWYPIMLRNRSREKMVDFLAKNNAKIIYNADDYVSGIEFEDEKAYTFFLLKHG